MDDNDTIVKTGLVRYDEACRAIAECHKIDEAKELHNQAKAMEVYMQQAKNFELERQAAEIRVRAEQRCGELLKQMKETGERTTGHAPMKQVESVSPIPLTLDDLGISPDQSSQWQKLAEIPAEEFERALKEEAKPSTEGVLRAAGRAAKKPTKTRSEPAKPKSVNKGDRLKTAILELADFSRPVNVTDIQDRGYSRFLIDVCPHIPWVTLTVVTNGNGSRSQGSFDGNEKWTITVDRELYEICEGIRPRPELNGLSLRVSFKELRDEVRRRRKANHDERYKPGATGWNPLQIDKAEQTEILDFVERRLDDFDAMLG